MKGLHIAEGLTLPIDAATQTFAFIARKGAGKTYTAGKLVELLLEAHVQVVVLDTVGNWYGLRIAADGKGNGFDVPVLGGLRGDIPLEATGGALIADIVVDTGRSIILDASQFSLADRKRFATAFGERLWSAKKAERHPSPLHLVIEESQLIVPQFTGRGEGGTARMLGIYEEIIRLGRNYGIGVSMITQRPQSVNKEVLNQTECLFVGQVNGSQERDALKKWITHQGMDVHLVDDLPGLPVGTFYVWSPQWLQLLERVKILKKTTFDASATPKVGSKPAQRRELKPLDLADLETQLKATIERQKADDPKELRRRIAELERELKKRELVPVSELVVEVPALSRADLSELNDRLEAARSVAAGLEAWAQRVERALAQAAPVPAKTGRSTSTKARDNGHRAPAPAITRQPARRGAAVEGVTPAQQRILDALAWLEAVNIAPAEKTQLALLIKVSPTSGGYFNNLGALRSTGLTWYPDAGRVALTDTGRLAAAAPDTPPTTEDLHEQVVRLLPPAKWKIVAALIDAYPKAIAKDELAEQIGVSPTSGGYFNNLGSLRTLGLIDYPAAGQVAARPVLFLEGS